MDDPTEGIRRKLVEEINGNPKTREELEKNGPVWDTQELQRDYEVKGFMAPFVVVKRKSDGAMGCMVFQHHPRFYFGFEADK